MISLKNISALFVAATLLNVACTSTKKQEEESTQSADSTATIQRIEADYITEKVLYDTDDPAIWYNKENPAQSLIIGTDKGDDDKPGGLYVYDLHGKIDTAKSITDLARPNNVDIAYGFVYQGNTIDIAVCTERYTNSIRVFKLPELEAIDNGGIKVFEGDSLNAPMGVSLYKRPSDETIFAIVGRKEGPKEGYLWQYKLSTSAEGFATGTVVRKFGIWSGIKEIEAIAVDDQLGHVYYSDEHSGVRKYFADPDAGNEEIAHFAKEGFSDDHEGISIYHTSDSTGYVIVSDQGSNEFHFYNREGDAHKLIAALPFSTMDSDGNEVSHKNFGPEFPEGIFVAMSTDKTFHIYDWRKIKKALTTAQQQ